MGGNSMKRAKIVVVDDDEEILSGLKELLTGEGMEVKCLSEGKEVVTTAKSYSPDLILLDTMLGDISGYKIKEELNREIPTSLIPVVFLTSNNTLQQKRRGLEAGAAKYIVKPVNTKELLITIESILTRKNFYENTFMKDSLTGLYNRTYFEKQAKILHNLSAKYSRPFSIVPLEIEDFDSIESKYGSAAVKYILKETAEVLKSTVRSMDMAVRFRGGEFLVLLPETDSDQASEYMSRLKSSLESAEYTYIGKTIDPDIDIGSVTCSSGELELEEMFRVLEMNTHINRLENIKGENSGLLIVEDEGDVANGIKLALESEGFKVNDILYDFDETVDYIKKSGKVPGFVILDLNLGGMLSPDLLGVLYDRWPNTKVFIFTGYPEYFEVYPYFLDIVSGAFEKSELSKLIKTLKKEIYS